MLNKQLLEAAPLYSRLTTIRAARKFIASKKGQRKDVSVYLSGSGLPDEVDLSPLAFMAALDAEDRLLVVKLKALGVEGM
jgi:hypothetical protein